MPYYGYSGTNKPTGFESDHVSEYDGGNGKYSKTHLNKVFGGLEGGVEGGAEGGGMFHDYSHNRKTSALVEGVVIVILLFLLVLTWLTGAPWLAAVAGIVVLVYLGLDYFCDVPGGWIENRNQTGAFLPTLPSMH
jgi:hypothetical protein